MTQKMAKLEMHLSPYDQHVFLDGVEITYAVHSITLSTGPGEVPAVQLGMLTLGGVVIPEVLMDVTVIDSHDAIRLREMLADAIIALETVMEAHDDAPTPKLREQIESWKRHQEFPEGEKLGRYIERMREYDARLAEKSVDQATGTERIVSSGRPADFLCGTDGSDQRDGPASD